MQTKTKILTLLFMGFSLTSLFGANDPMTGKELEGILREVAQKEVVVDENVRVWNLERVMQFNPTA